MNDTQHLYIQFSHTENEYIFKVIMFKWNEDIFPILHDITKQVVNIIEKTRNEILKCRFGVLRKVGISFKTIFNLDPTHNQTPL